MGERALLGENLQKVGTPLLRSGIALNLLWIGRLKFEDYEVENIRPLLRSSPLFAPLLDKLGERRVARVVGLTEMAMGAVIAAKPAAPRAAAVASLGAVAMFGVTLSFLATTPEAWQSQSRDNRESKLSPAGQFLVKDVVLLPGALLVAADALKAVRRR